MRDDTGSRTEADAGRHEFAHRPLPDFDVDPDQPPHVRLVSDPDPADTYAALVRLQQVYGMCTACGSVEVALCKVTGVRDLSGIGEHHAYPTGYGCEVCA
jgi:hypothetical protein